MSEQLSPFAVVRRTPMHTLLTKYVDRHILWYLPVSNSLRREMENLGYGRNFRIVPNAVDGAIFQPRGSIPREQRLLFVGRLARQKGLDVLLEALPLIASRFPEVSLEVIGGGDETTYRTHARKVGLESIVRFTGRADRNELRRAFERASVLVLPSRHESFGCVLIEALSAGVPVVATKVGGPQDIVDDGLGELVAPDNHVELGEAVTRVLARVSSFNPRDLHWRVQERFGIEAVAAKIDEVYRLVAS